MKNLESNSSQEAKVKKTWLKSVFKQLIKAEAIIVIWEDKSKFRMANNIDSQAAVSEILVQIGNEAMGKWDEYQKTVLAEHKKRIEESKKEDKK